VFYLPLFEGNDGDHRGLFIDISNAMLDNKVELKRPEKRTIGSARKGSEIFHYKNELDEQCVSNQLYKKAEEASVSTFLPKIPESLEKTIQGIDNQLTAFMLKAENSCCTKRHESAWSIALHNQSVV
jgi:hypothetical protein